jgi:protoporphyrin/coproporphyrin ferrochelatase
MMTNAEGESCEKQSSPAKKHRWGVLLLAHGAPERLEDVAEFLLNVRGGRKLPEAAVREITARYVRIGGGSPLLRLTRLQAKSLEALLNSRSDGKSPLDACSFVPVAVGMRNWRPFVVDGVRELAAADVGHIVAICLAPQNSSTSVGLYTQRLRDAVASSAPNANVTLIQSWHDHPDLIAAFSEKVSYTMAEATREAQTTVPVIFTAHSVPKRTIDAGDPYEVQAQQTAQMVAHAAKLSDWRLAFQSQGMTQEEWLGPTVEAEINRLATAGHRHVLIAPIGFVSDHVEVLYDIDVAFREYAAGRAMKLWRTESLNDSPLLVQALARLVWGRMSDLS